MALSVPQPAALARAALARGLQRSAPGIAVDLKGYVADAVQNLIPGVVLADVEADLRQGDGNELEGKFRAAHSSSALAINAFAPFKSSPADLQLAEQSEFSALQFERKCHHGIVNRRAPNLDVLAEGDSHVVAVESKCLEFLSAHTAEFSSAYETEIVDARREGPWFAHMLALNAEPKKYRWLDAAQLVKHAFGLAHTFPERAVTLLYLFWEPTNPEAYPIFAAHRAEIALFAHSVKGGAPAFAAMSYPEVWRAWDAVATPKWLSTHVARLRSRYAVAI